MAYRLSLITNAYIIDYMVLIVNKQIIMLPINLGLNFLYLKLVSTYNIKMNKKTHNTKFDYPFKRTLCNYITIFRAELQVKNIYIHLK